MTNIKKRRVIHSFLYYIFLNSFNSMLSKKKYYFDIDFFYNNIISIIIVFDVYDDIDH